jgi:hypothetical protein
MCYERWSEGEQVTDALRKARKEADKMIEKARSSPPRPAPPETQPRPAVEHDEQAA